MLLSMVARVCIMAVCPVSMGATMLTLSLTPLRLASSCPNELPCPQPHRTGIKGATEMGVVLWSHGRSATTTLSNTFQKVTSFPYCNGLKEGFMGLARRRKNLTLQTLQDCINRGQRFLHMKPKHLHQERSALKTAGQFFNSAWLAGFRTVISTFRSNQLAREVSSYERMHTVKGHTNEAFATRVSSRQLAHSSSQSNWNVSDSTLAKPSLIRLFAHEHAAYTEGVRAAKAQGFVVITLNFDDVTTELCGSFKRIFEQMLMFKNVTGYSRTSNAHCKTASRGISEIHANVPSHHRLPLAERIGGDAAAQAVVDELRGSPYEWMLNLSATTPPRKQSGY